MEVKPIPVNSTGDLQRTETALYASVRLATANGVPERVLRGQSIDEGLDRRLVTLRVTASLTGDLNI